MAFLVLALRGVTDEMEYSLSKRDLIELWVHQIWSDLYPDARVDVLAACSSDHAPLYVSLNPELMGQRGNHASFHDEAAWNRNDTPREIIRRVWRVG